MTSTALVDAALLCSPCGAVLDIVQGFVMAIFLLSGLLLVLVVLLQEGKGGGIAGAFGGAGAETFGVKAGTVNRFTFWVGGIFLATAVLHAGLESTSALPVDLNKKMVAPPLGEDDAPGTPPAEPAPVIPPGETPPAVPPAAPPAEAPPPGGGAAPGGGAPGGAPPAEPAPAPAPAPVPAPAPPQAPGMGG